MPSFLDQGRTFTVDPSDDTSLARVYRDEPLPTALNERGRPRSSSTAPWLMAQMLESLDLRPGQRVLEIGAGTGYNAAHLARLVGPNCFVNTIEIDPDLARRARAALTATDHRNVAVHTADATSVPPPGGPYDRILVTAGFWQLPAVLWGALRPKGVLVGSFGRRLIGPIAVMTKDDDGCGTGRFLPGPNISFTPLVGSGVAVVPHVRFPSEERENSVWRSSDFDPSFIAPEHVGSLFVLQLEVPEADLRWYPPQSVTEVRDEATGEVARFRKGSSSGSRTLVSRLERVQRTWLDLGRPEPPRFRIRVSPDGELRLAVGANGKTGPAWTIPSIDRRPGTEEPE